MKEKGEYLSRKIEKPHQLMKEQIAESSERLDQPLASFEYKDKDEAIWEKGELKASFKYQNLPENLYLSSPIDLKKLNMRDQSIIRQMNLSPKSFRELTHFSLDNNQSKIDLFDLLPKGYNVYFSPSFGEKGSAMHPYAKVLILRGVKPTPKTILDMLHETGHAVDYDRMNEEEIGKMQKTILRYHDAKKSTGLSDSKNIDKLTAEDAAFVLRSERDAWSFALKQIKPFLEDLNINKEDLKVYIHNEMLAAYSDSIRKVIEKGLMDEVK